jgi:hypothetical protein
MKKKFLVTQPPNADHFTLLVDDINETATIGHTTDIEKCEYNRQVIEKLGLDIDFIIQVQTAFSDKGITAVIPAGRYIAIIKASKDETKQEMFFIDSTSKADFRQQNATALGGYFSDNIVNEFEKVHKVLRTNLTDEDDLVELSLVEDDLQDQHHHKQT